MIADFHTHILPCIDDGSKSIDESIQMLLKESEMGIEHVVLTPHFYPTRDNPITFLERRKQAYHRLQEEVKKYPTLPTLHLGAEVHYFDGIGNWEGLKDLTICGTNYVLIEMPMTKWTSRMYEALENIVYNLGLIPIIAHMDRYISPVKNHDIPKKLSTLPVVIQVNSSFFMKSLTSSYAMKLMKAGMIHVVGSDCHNMTSRLPNLDEAFKKIEDKLGKEMLNTIFINSEEILK